MSDEPISLEIEGYRCICGHKMGTHDIRALDYSEVVESPMAFPCMSSNCDCGDYNPKMATGL